MKHTLIFFAFFFGPTCLFAQTLSFQNLSLSIEPLIVHFIDAEEKIINVSVQNESLIPVNLLLSKNALNNIYIEVYDELSFPVPINPHIVYIRENENTELETIRLESNEIYSMVLNLEDYVNFKNLGLYSISMRFYPRTTEYDKEYIVSNTALFSLLDTSETINNSSIDADFYTSNTEQTENFMLPEEVVDAALSYLQVSDWNGFLRTVNLRELFLNTAQTKSNFANLDIKRQRKELLNFAEKIKKDEIYGFLTGTEDYSIDETRKTASKAMVSTMLSKVQHRILNTRTYVFFLEKRQNAWRIVNFNTKLISSKRQETQIPNERLLSNLDYLLPAEFVTEN